MTNSVEFIGAKIKIIQAANKSLESLEGCVINETKNTFKIKTNNQEEKTVLKQGAIFIINNQQIKGDEITKRPEERIKRKK
ncbi:ribonuclease P protein subunit [Candidatus Woesearchaeota archaeon]|nr:ribonuclease P protein subunit [Candidatus Woesearchaeota archaeon]